MSDPVQRTPVRPLPGGPDAGDAVRHRTLLDAFRGWPDGLPYDRRLAARVRYELSRTSVQKDLAQRASGTFGLTSSFWRPAVSLWLVGLVAHEAAVRLLGETAFTAALFVAIVVIVVGLTTSWGVRSYHGPRLRAGLRREGVDCCIGCGQLMARGEDSDRCSECGRTHEDFPLGWGPGPIGGDRAGAPDSHETPEP